MKVGFIGLGTMGQPMARRVARAGYEVIAWNRTRARVEALSSDMVVAVGSPAEASQCEVLISMLSDDASLEATLWANGRLVSAGVPGLVHLCMASISDRLARRLTSEHAALGQAYLSAPVFGPPESAQSGRLLIATAGSRPHFERVRPLLETMGRTVHLADDPPAANVVKAAGSFLMASVVESLRDATALVHAAGVDPREFTGIVTQSLFPTPVYQYLGGMLANREALHGARVPNPFLKATEQCSASAAELGVKVPMIDHVSRR